LTEPKVFEEIMGFPPLTKPPLEFFTSPTKGPPRFIPKRLGDEVQSALKFFATSERSELWLYSTKKGIWRPKGKEIVQAITANWLGDLFHPIYATNTSKYIRYSNYIDPMIVGGPKELVVMENGVYNLLTDEFTEHDPDLYAVAAIPVKYDPNAECPKTLKFLSEIVSPGDAVNLIEFFGYCLYKDYPVARLVILEGEGENGKSTLLRLLKRFLGPENVSSVSMQRISDEGFRTASLVGKLANICADIPSKPIKDAGLLKLVSGEDTITVERKYHDPHDFMNHAKLIFSANKVPPSWDQTLAWHRRPVLIPFPNRFSKEDPKTDLSIIDKISTPEEMSGIFNIAVKGLKKFLDQKGFTNELSVEKRRIQYMRSSDPIQYFATIFVEKHLESSITKADLYTCYVNVCVSLGQVPKANNTFGREVRRHLPYIYDGQDTKTKATLWRGIRVNHELLKDLERVERAERVKTSVLDITGYSKLPYNRVSALSALDALSNLEENDPVSDPVISDTAKRIKTAHSLGGRIEEYLEIFDEKSKVIGEKVIEEAWFFRELVAMGWKATEVKQVTDLLKREDRMFNPRVGWLKRC